LINDEKFFGILQKKVSDVKKFISEIKAKTEINER